MAEAPMPKDVGQLGSLACGRALAVAAGRGLAAAVQNRMAGERGEGGDGEGDEVVLTRPARTWVPVLIMVCFFCQ